MIVDGKVQEIPVNDKYVVFKREEWEKAVILHEADSDIVQVKDAVVIRLQDIFAQSALWTYGNEIRAALEVLELIGVNSETPMVGRLQEIADYFEHMSYVAGKLDGKKVPD